MHFKTVLAHLKSKFFSVGQPWWPTFFQIQTLLNSHVRSGSVPDDRCKIVKILIFRSRSQEHFKSK